MRFIAIASVAAECRSQKSFAKKRNFGAATPDIITHDMLQITGRVMACVAESLP